MEQADQEQNEAPATERQRTSFYQRLRTFKYACIIQLLTTLSLFFFLLIDMGFKVLQSESSNILKKMVQDIDTRILYNCSSHHNITMAIKNASAD